MLTIVTDGSIGSCKEGISGVQGYLAKGMIYGKAQRQHAEVSSAGSEMGIPQALPTPVYTDAKINTFASKGVNALHKALHVARRAAFIWQGDKLKITKTIHANGPANFADGFTKALRKAEFEKQMAVWLNLQNAVPYSAKHGDTPLKPSSTESTPKENVPNIAGDD